jgi:hypothetical protein
VNTPQVAYSFVHSMTPQALSPFNNAWCSKQGAPAHLQMTVVQPRVSTDGSVRTIACRCAILHVPSARQVVTTALWCSLLSLALLLP